MRVLQNFLLMAASTLTGMLLGFFAVALLCEKTQDVSEPAIGRAMSEILLAVFLGLPLGGLSGLVASVAWIRSIDRPKIWSPWIWLGIMLGCIAGVWVSFSTGAHSAFEWYGTSLFMVSGSLIGGIIAKVASSLITSAIHKRRGSNG